MNLPKPRKIGRYAVCILLVAVCFLVYEVQLFQWQIVNGDVYQRESLENRTDAIELDAARGQIMTRDRQVLAGNKTVYNIVYNALGMVSRERNATIIKVVDLLEDRGEKWRDILPIFLDEEGEYQFAENREYSIAALKSKEMLNLAEYATAEDCMRELEDWFGCKGYSSRDARNVASVRYAMYREGFSRTNPFVLAEDVSAETVGVISQMGLPGIESRVSVKRYYGEDGTLAPHVVGHVGAIQDWQLEAAEKNGTTYHYRDNISGYKLNDTAGVSGLEYAFETDLRGKRGQESIFTDETGAVKSTAVTTPPEEGHTVVTTIDADLQRVANLSLAKNIKANTAAAECIAGAAVVLDVKDFGVLASSSYPTFDINRYLEDEEYSDQVNNDNDLKPMYNRALDGEFVPGSVFKPMVALAALQEGTIASTTTYFCDKMYTLGDDEDTQLKLACTDYHGSVNVYNGLAGSCNVFFCNVGVNLTIRKMDAYAKYFGLGEKTGVELGESSGNMSNPQDYFERHGEQWLEGASAQTAIGQADNLFTPIQLAAYCATIANGGKRLETHFLDKITDYTGEEVVRQYEPRELYDAGISQDVLNVVREGMIGVASYGTASGVFGDYPVAIACKTGTAENAGKHGENLSFICFAPVNDPEIAIAVMIEYGDEGDYAKLVAKDILDQYFGFYTWDEKGNRYDQYGNLVNDAGEVLRTKEELDAERAREEERKQEEFLAGAEGTESSREPEENASQTAGRGDIPTAPFTGDGTTGGESLPETDVSLPPEVSEDSPYYRGGNKSSGSG